MQVNVSLEGERVQEVEVSYSKLPLGKTIEIVVKVKAQGVAGQKACSHRFPVLDRDINRDGSHCQKH